MVVASDVSLGPLSTYTRQFSAAQVILFLPEWAGAPNAVTSQTTTNYKSCLVWVWHARLTVSSALACAKIAFGNECLAAALKCQNLSETDISQSHASAVRRVACDGKRRRRSYGPPPICSGRARTRAGAQRGRAPRPRRRAIDAPVRDTKNDRYVTASNGK